MKVKAIYIRGDLDERPEQVENPLQDWLNDNPNASIEHVAQTPIRLEQGGRVTGLMVTIFYRD